MFVQDFEQQFLFLLKASLNNEKLPDEYHFAVDRVFSLAMMHNLLPIIYIKALECQENISAYKASVLKSCGRQIAKNNNFEELFKRIIKAEISVIVVKGPICAFCYDVEYNRLSSDFDIVVSIDDKEKLHNFLLCEGFYQQGESYICEQSGLYLEVSTRLGEGDDRFALNADRAFGDFFGAQNQYGVYISLKPEYHLVYLIYHAFKHFIGSGFGLKQIADIYMFIKHYNAQLDFEMIYNMIDEIDIRSFADNVFCLIDKLFDYKLPFFSEMNIDYICTDDFLADLLDAGVFGKSTENRLHSASVVHNTVENDGKKSFLKTIFPSAEYMKTKFSILHKLPFLLPLFWIVRLVQYVFSATSKDEDISPKKTIMIADSRIELIKKMGII